MYDVCDVINASFSSADVTTHILRSYGDGNMGKGIRKLAGEMRTIGGIESYKIGYESGVSDTYPVAFNNGFVTGTILGVCVCGIIGFVAWYSRRTENQNKEVDSENESFVIEEVFENEKEEQVGCN
ncbi:MAG: hypothetical protein IJP09_02335 [Clostridia bacterium]|nr:hypothetical protein [Clostridia bacterium]